MSFQVPDRGSEFPRAWRIALHVAPLAIGIVWSAGVTAAAILGRFPPVLGDIACACAGFAFATLLPQLRDGFRKFPRETAAPPAGAATAGGALSERDQAERLNGG